METRGMHKVLGAARFDCGHCKTPGSMGQVMYIEGKPGAVLSGPFGGAPLGLEEGRVEWTVQGYAICGNCGRGSALEGKYPREITRTGNHIQARPMHATQGFEAPGRYGVTRTAPGLTEAEPPEGTPAEVSRRYEDAVGCYRHGLWRPAAGALRAAVEQALGKREKENLYQAIERAQEEGKITKTMATWAQTQRSIGNEAMHDKEGHEPKPEEIEGGIACLEALLRCIYEMPHHQLMYCLNR